jgi:ABC-2 type transport system permease protein
MTTDAPPIEPESFGRPIKGPSMLGDSWRRLAQLTWALAITDFKLRFFGSALGYLWTLLRPLMLFGVLYVVFGIMLDFGGQAKYFEVSMLLGIVMFTFLNESTSGAVRSVVNREPIVRKVEFPRAAVPLATVLTACFNLMLNLIPVVVFLLISGGRPLSSWLLFPICLVALIAFAIGLAMFLSATFVKYRDVEPIWEVMLQAMFYATPIFYTVEDIVAQTEDQTYAQVVMCSPFAMIVQQAKHWFIDPSHNSAYRAIGYDLPLVAIPLFIGVATIVVGLLVFRREAPRIAEDL